jgi:periplasmic divalent cation tolerance protein
MDMRLVLVTHPSKEHAERITRGVIDAKLAACVLVTDVKSFYNWEGKLNEDGEVVTLLKTSTNKATDLEKYIEANHDYDIPAIISFQANANESYGNWLNDQLNLYHQKLHSYKL